MAQVCRALLRRNMRPSQAGRAPIRTAPSTMVSRVNRTTGATTTNRPMTSPSAGHPCLHREVALEIRWLCSEAPSTLVVRNVNPLAGSSSNSAAIEMASAASTLRPVNRSSPTPQTPQSSTPT